MIYEGDSEMQLRNSLMGLEVVECPGCHSSVAKVEGMVCLCGRYGWEKDGWCCESTDFGKFIVLRQIHRPDLGELLEVQPLAGPVGQVFYMDYVRMRP